MTPFERPRHTVYGLLLTAALATASPLPAFAEEPHHFEISTGDAPQAIHQFGAQSGVQILASAEQLAGKKLNEVAGTLSTDDGLRQLLAGTGITHRYVGDRTVALVTDQPGVAMNATTRTKNGRPEAAKEAQKMSFWDRFRLAQVDRGTASDASVNPSPAQASVLEEVLVTAQKRTENVQNVPSSVSVFSDERLQQLHANTLTDYAAYMPGVNVSTAGSPGQTTVTLRGIAPMGPGAVVGFYLDDTPFGSSGNYARSAEFGLDVMPYDVDHVEVLRGPQGTLYGSGSMGGLLKYALRSPDLAGLQLRAGVDTSATHGADDLGWGARAAMNVPLVSDRLALWMSYARQALPGYIDNALTGRQDENPADLEAGRASLLWQINDDASLKLGGMWQRIDSQGNAGMSLTLTGVNPPTGVPSRGDLVSFHPLEEPFKKDVDYYSATLNWDMGWASFVSATSFSKTHTLQESDVSFIFAPLYPLLSGGIVPPEGSSLFRLTLDLDKVTQEFRLTSPSGGKVEWLLGVYYTDEDSDNLQEIWAYDTGRQPIPAFEPYFAFAQIPTNYQELAGFGDLTFQITDRFDVTAGLRWARNSQRYREITSGAILAQHDVRTDSAENVLTYMVSPRFRLNDDSMIYARVATGYRPGGPGLGLLGAPPSVDADTLTNYEVGIKTQFLEHRALVNLSVFYIDWSDMQQSVQFGGVSATANSGDSSSRGVELESAYSPFSGLRLGLNATYTDATLDAAPKQPNNKIGAPLPGVPEWSASLTADYDFALSGAWAARIGGGYRYVDEQGTRVVTLVNNLSYIRPSYTAVDLYSSLSHDNWTLRLFAKNVTDERAYIGGGAATNGFNVPYGIEVAVLQPRTLGVSVDVTF